MYLRVPDQVACGADDPSGNPDLSFGLQQYARDDRIGSCLEYPVRGGLRKTNACSTPSTTLDVASLMQPYSQDDGIIHPVLRIMVYLAHNCEIWSLELELEIELWLDKEPVEEELEGAGGREKVRIGELRWRREKRKEERGKRAGRSIRRYRDHRTVAPRSLHLNAFLLIRGPIVYRAEVEFKSPRTYSRAKSLAIIHLLFGIINL
ncbi:hypothetical protein KQX54_007736 [Cotesia glomerata]|uniref:Uncharacterized protein n=1 Tax=Cotesia glomerata TaxID=32391 RepID=A0AAV7J4X5_COTGL|nr:hypothetical protein KQX54_007736 [Cotesia glomerata]